jgi:hypothetical protein
MNKINIDTKTHVSIDVEKEKIKKRESLVID